MDAGIKQCTREMFQAAKDPLGDGEAQSTKEQSAAKMFCEILKDCLKLCCYNIVILLYYLFLIYVIAVPRFPDLRFRPRIIISVHPLNIV